MSQKCPECGFETIQPDICPQCNAGLDSKASLYERRVAELQQEIRDAADNAYRVGFEDGYAAGQEEAERAAN